MAADGWYPEWFAAGWFPEVWFAPADESGLSEEELAPVYREAGKGGPNPPRKRKKRREQYNDDDEVMAIASTFLTLID